jgi:GNAT superfamily N-acetyltransferase
MPDLKMNVIKTNPGLISAAISLPNGMALNFRPLTLADTAPLGRYFLGLSDQTKEVYGPHTFDQPTADRLCAEIDITQTVRMVAVDAQGEFIAYFILDWLIREKQLERYAGYGLLFDPPECCQIAPSVLDGYQSQGIGTPLMQHVFDIARRAGRRYMQLTEGVCGHNARGIHYYQKLGFRQAGVFYPSWGNGRPSYDMYVEL